MSSNDSYPQYVVTAVIVAHDGAAWLPSVADALLHQTRAVQRVVAVDTGSRDRSGAVLASKFGQSAVFGMDRGTGYGAAIARALAHRAAILPVQPAQGIPPGDRVEWIWLLHDDCEPAPDALEQLLRGAAETSAAAVLGPKLRDFSNRQVVLEAGVTLDTAARRVTGIEPREVDQGQHDGDRDALAVSSAGMLVRRDVWEQIRGFDTAMGLFMEDIDFCWRVHSAGYRVRVITDAVCYHAQAAARHRRTISVGRRARMLDRRNGLLTLLGNLPFFHMLGSAAGNVVVSLLRTAFFLLAKRLSAAFDEAAAATAVMCHPVKLIGARRRRRAGRRAAYARIRADLPAGHSARRAVEFAASTVLKSARTEISGAHHASIDPTDDDSLLVDNGLGKRLLTSPALVTFAALLAIALVAGRSLIGGGPLAGGSLVPAWGGAVDLWHSYLAAFHPSGLGSTSPAPAYLGVLAVIATVLAGKPWLAIDVMLIGCVPLAGLTAMFAVRKITTSVAIRVWASATYALLPIAMGVIAAGRFGSALAFVLLPLIALTAGSVVTQPGQRASRAAWATGLLVAIGAAFVPLLWLVTVAGCVVTAVALRNTRPGLLRNLVIIVLTAPVLLLPWDLTVVTRPATLLLDAGLPQPGTPASGLPAKSLILLSPGGPGLPPYWVTAGLLAVGLAALFAGRRRKLITAGWGVALAGMLLAVVISHLVITPQEGGSIVLWAGLPLAIAAIGLLLAACVGAEALGRMLTSDKGKGLSSVRTAKGTWAAIIAVIACSAPLLAAAFWLDHGVVGPVHKVSGQVVPELVAVADGQSRQVRTLVLRSAHGRISYLLLRGPSPSIGDPSLLSPPGARQALAQAVAALTTPDGGLAVNQGRLLADFDIGYVMVQAPVSQRLSSALNDVTGLRPYSTTSSYALWQLVTPPSRVSVLEPDGTMVPVAAGQVGVAGTAAPASGGILMLAEPAGGWSAALNGHPLTPVASPAGAWAQAFRLPPGGGSLDIGYGGLAHAVWLVIELLALLVVTGLALPGIHLADEPQRSDLAAVADEAGTAGHARPGSDREPGDEPDAVGEHGSATARSRRGSPRTRARRGVLAGAAGLAARSGRGAARGGAKAGHGRQARSRAAAEPARSRGTGPAGDQASRSRADESALAAGAGRGDADAASGRMARRGQAERGGGSRSRARMAPSRAADDSQPLPAMADHDDDRNSTAWPYQASEQAVPDRASPGRAQVGRSPSGAPPPARWSRRPSRSRADDSTDYQLAGSDTGGSARDEPRSTAASWPQVTPSDRRGDWAGLRSAGPGQRQPGDYETGHPEPERYPAGGRHGRSRAGLGRDRGERGDSGTDPAMAAEPAYPESGRRQSEPDRYPHRGESFDDRSARRPGQSRAGRRGRQDRISDTPRFPRPMTGRPDARDQSASPASWPGTGGDQLEPLPSADGPAPAESHRAAWGPDSGDTGGWRRSRARGADPGRSPRRRGDSPEPGRRYEPADDYPPEDRRGMRRWSAPEQDYEGDTW